MSFLTIDPKIVTRQDNMGSEGFLAPHLPMNRDEVYKSSIVCSVDINGNIKQDTSESGDKVSDIKYFDLNELQRCLNDQVGYNLNLLQHAKSNSEDDEKFYIDLLGLTHDLATTKKEKILDEFINIFYSGIGNEIDNGDIATPSSAVKLKYTMYDVFKFLDNEAWHIVAECVNDYNSNSQQRFFYNMLKDNQEWSWSQNKELYAVFEISEELDDIPVSLMTFLIDRVCVPIRQKLNTRKYIEDKEPSVRIDIDFNSKLAKAFSVVVNDLKEKNKLLHSIKIEQEYSQKKFYHLSELFD